MKINIQNPADVSNRAIDRLVSRLNKLTKFQEDIVYADVWIKTEGSSSNAQYVLSLKLGVPGNDVVVSHKNRNFAALIGEVMEAAKRQLKELYED